MLSILILISIVIDIDWLISIYVPDSLNSNEDEMAYKINQEAYIIRTIVWYITVVGIALKLVSLIIHIRISGNGRNLLRRLWKKTFVFFPPISYSPKPEPCVKRIFKAISNWMHKLDLFQTMYLQLNYAC